MSRLSKLGRKAAPVANQIFGPKSWKIGAMIAGGAVAAKALGGGAAGGAIAGSLLPAVIGAGADIYSANQIAEGQAEANAASIASARESMAFQGEQAQKQMDFQERMSGTAVQRRMADLKAAGINPVLAGVEGASAPVGAAGGGAQATIENEAPDYRGVVPKGIQTAIQLKQMQKDFEQVDADISVRKAQKELLDRQAMTESQTAKQKIEEVEGQRLENLDRSMELDFNIRHPWLYNTKRIFSSMAPAASSARDAALLYKALTFDGSERSDTTGVQHPDGGRRWRTIRVRGGDR